MVRNKKMYDDIGREFEVSADRYLNRHAFYAQELMSKAMIAIISPSVSGPNVQKWRDMSTSNATIARWITMAVYEFRGPVKLAVLLALAGDADAKETSIKKCLADGVRLKLLKRVRGGYLPTHLLVDELQDRMGEKMMNEDVQRFCRFVVMWGDQRKFALDAIEHNDDRDFNGGTKSTFLEQILNGDFDQKSVGI